MIIHNIQKPLKLLKPIKLNIIFTNYKIFYPYFMYYNAVLVFKGFHSKYKNIAIKTEIINEFKEIKKIPTRQTLLEMHVSRIPLRRQYILCYLFSIFSIVISLGFLLILISVLIRLYSNFF